MAVVMKPTEEEGIPFSCSTNLSNDVDKYLGRAKLGSRALEFCLYMRRQTFGKAGWHRQKGRREFSCEFDLAEWGRELECDRSNLKRILNDLVACHILLFEPGKPGSGKGRVTWNLHFEEWLRYDGRKTKPRKGQEQPLLVISNQASLVILRPETEDISLSAIRKITKDGCYKSDKITKPACQNNVKITKDASCSHRPEAAPPAGEELSTEEYKTEEDQEATPLTAGAVGGPVVSDELFPEVAKKTRTPSKSQKHPKAAKQPSADQGTRRALFGKLTELFASGDPRHVELLRDKFNTAIKKFMVVSLQPPDLEVLKLAYEDMWPRATCTALGLANNIPVLSAHVTTMGYCLGAGTPEEQREAGVVPVVTVKGASNGYQSFTGRSGRDAGTHPGLNGHYTGDHGSYADLLNGD